MRWDRLVSTAERLRTELYRSGKIDLVPYQDTDDMTESEIRRYIRRMERALRS